MSKFFHFSLPLTDGTLMTTVRLTVGGITAAAGLDVDEGEDFKVCVTAFRFAPNGTRHLPRASEAPAEARRLRFSSAGREAFRR